MGYYKGDYSGIYIITNTLDGKYYIGYSSTILKRLKEHRRLLIAKEHSNDYLQNAVNLHGIENFSFEELERYPDEGFILPSMEHYWCNLLDAHNRDFGYNLTPTDPYNTHKIAPETLEKQRIIQKKKYEMGYKNPMQGRKQTEETKQKISQIKTGKNLGVKQTQEHKDKISKGNKGQKRSKEICDKLSILRSNTVNQYDLEGNFVKTWDSVKIASEQLGIKKATINNCCHGNQKHAGGYKWKLNNKNEKEKKDT